MESIKTYLSANKERFLEELLDLLRIPSLSADPAYKDEVRKAAQFLETKLNDLGLDAVEIFETPGHPIVFGQKILNEAYPTILVYGHYDVQPPDPIDLWDAPPFEPVIKDEKIYARGASDDKGQMYMHVKALEMLLAEGLLKCNVKMLIEGEEEVGSDNLESFVREHKELLKADLVLISDTAMIANDIPSITTGLRGLSYLEVEVTGPNRDLHSGVYGGAVQNPINALCEMIASIKDDDGFITIPGFYKNVVSLTDEDRSTLGQAPFDLALYKKYLAIDDVSGEKDYSTLERASIRPSFDVNGIWGGYIGEGAKTVLPSKAYAKVSMRLVPNQTSEEITQLFTDHFLKIAPLGVKVKVSPHHGGEAAVVPTDSIAYQAASLALKETYGKAPIPQRSGGSIPIVALFEKVLGLKSLLLGFGLDSDNIHSPNEHYGLFNYYKGIATISYFYHHYAELVSKNK